MPVEPGDDEILEIRPHVRQALDERRPVVALESAVLTHGLPSPENLEAARSVERAVREEGAVPAVVGVLEGRAAVGLEPAELERLADTEDVLKLSSRDLASAVVGGATGGATVAAAVRLADRAGIRVLATGGIGGVHRRVGESFDVSADLLELRRSRVAVVCSGPKAVLDLPRTLEALETLALPVIGFGADELPGFYSRGSGLRLDVRVESAREAAAVLEVHWRLGLGGLLIAVPPPSDAALDRREVEGWLDAALEAAAATGVSGKAITPFLLARLAESSRGRTVRANLALLEENARVAARIAAALLEVVGHR